MTETTGRPTATHVTALRRYPVKAMGGEPLGELQVDGRGVVGDRWYAVVDDDGRFASGKSSRRFRRRDEVFDHGAWTTDDGVRVRGPAGEWRVGDPELDRALSAAMDAPVRVRPEGTTSHFDAAPVSIVGTASLAWCTTNLRVDADARRLRPNVVLATTEPFVEESWVGVELTIGSAVLRVTERIERCRMVDLAQDGVTTTTPMLTALGGEREVCLGVYAEVVVPGRVAVGDVVRLALGR